MYSCRVPAAVLGSLLATVLLTAPLAAQRHAATDLALSGSLLAAGLPFPSSSHGPLLDPDVSGAVLRGDVQYSHTIISGSPAPMAIVGLRSEFTGRDSSGLSTGALAVRLGYRGTAEPGTTEPGTTEPGTTEPGTAMRLSAVELSAGIRTLSYLADRSWPDVGIDRVLGWSEVRDDTRTTFGIRIPVEFIREVPSGWLSWGLAPTIAWGRLRLQSCEDNGPGNNCGDLGIQLDPGRTHFLLAAGASLGLEPAGPSLSIGAQHLFANGQQPRAMLGVGWSH